MKDEFEPRLGRIRANNAGGLKRFRNQVLRAAALTGGGRRSHGAAKSFDGSRIGRGASLGRMLGAHDRYATTQARRVVVKFRIAKMANKGLGVARAHLRYIQRDGVTREGRPGQLYSAEQDRADRKAFLARSDGDRHQFRLIVSAEDGTEYVDLKPLTRRLMIQMEEDLETKLDWIAVDHHNTGHPHTHIIIRGRTDRDQDLVVSRAYLTEGVRERAAEIVDLDLGPRTYRQIETRLRATVDQERLTGLDQSLLRDADGNGLVAAGGYSTFQQAVRAARLQKLKRFGLAEEVSPGAWRLAPDLEATLRRMGERGDIIKTLHRDLAAKNIARRAVDYAIFDPAAAKRPLVGRLLRRGLSDELYDRHYLIVDGVDGRAHYVDIGRGEATETIAENAIVAIAPRRAEVREVDRTIAEIAAANNGRYSLDIHLRHDPSAHAAFAQAHLRRLEALRRRSDLVDREPNGTFVVAPNHLDRVLVHEHELLRGEPVTVQILSAQRLERLVGSDGATWLDRQLVAEPREPLRDAGFGRDVQEALARRQRWLITEGLAVEEADGVRYRANLLDLLRQRDLARVAAQLCEELGLDYVESRSGGRIDGVYRRAVDLASGRFAVIEKSREFTLAPWRPALERSLGQQVFGVMRDDGVSWILGRSRGGPSIS